MTKWLWLKLFLITGSILLGYVFGVIAQDYQSSNFVNDGSYDLGIPVDTWQPDSIYIDGDNMTIHIAGDNNTVVFGKDGE